MEPYAEMRFLELSAVPLHYSRVLGPAIKGLKRAKNVSVGKSPVSQYVNCARTRVIRGGRTR